MTTNELSAWTLYDSPADAPGYFVLRRWVVDSNGERATPQAFLCKDAQPLRDKMRERGLTCVPRHPEDEPQIVEVWL